MIASTENYAGSDGYEDQLKNISEEGVAPETRVTEPDKVVAWMTNVIQADAVRAKRRAIVKGIVDGNPPYVHADMVKAGKAHQCNVNWRIAEAFLLQAVGAVYDIFSETATKTEIRLDEEDRVKQEEWSNIVNEEFERLQSKDTELDFNMQLSQHDMVLYGNGPLAFEDQFSPAIRAIPCGNLYVKDATKSNVSEWEACGIIDDYSPTDLWEFIKDPETASRLGWNVEATRQAIMQAHPVYKDNVQGGRQWEWHQQQIRNNNFGYCYANQTVRIGTLLWKEFAKAGERSKISKALVCLGETENKKAEFLYHKTNLYDDWHEAINPMYYDHGDGQHHSVKGLGIKFYSALEYQNRLISSIADKAMQPKIMLRPLNSDAAMKTSVMQMGDYLIAPQGYDVSQVGFSGMLEDALIAKRDFESLLASNLSQYRQNLQKDEGNPITATEANFRVTEQAKLGKTQLARYYEQLDYVYKVRYLRACDASMPAGVKLYAECKEFRERCKKRGVPLEAMKKIESVKATRTIGQGSAMLRLQTLSGMLQLLATLPEGGRTNLLRDFIAASAGQVLVDRYYPSAEIQKLPSDHVAFAMEQVAGMKVGVPPVVTDSQEHVTYIATFLKAAFEAVHSLEQGAQPEDVAHFIELDGAAIQAHIAQIEKDPSRKELVKGFKEQLKQLSQIHDKLLQQIKKNQQQRQQQMQKQQQVMNDQQLAQFSTQQEEQRKNFKVAQDNRRKELKLRQQMRLNDAQTASTIELKRYQAFSE